MYVCLMLICWAGCSRVPVKMKQDLSHDQCTFFSGTNSQQTNLCIRRLLGGLFGMQWGKYLVQ
jgi:hypothetical protein